MFFCATLVSTVLLCLIHLYVGRFRIFDRGQGQWKSAAGGVGIAYTFLILMPKIAKAQPVLEQASGSGIYSYLVHHSYLVALFGLVFYYGMDAAVENMLVRPDRRDHRLWVRLLLYLHASALSGYYFVVSYLMTEDSQPSFRGYLTLTVFVLAMLFHYATIDHGLRAKYGGIYDPFLRWAFCIASASGWLVATTTTIPYTSLALLNCFFAGSLIVFTLKEKVPETGYVRLRPFLCGVGGYTILLLIIEALAY